MTPKFGLFFDTLAELQVAHAKLMGAAPVAAAAAPPPPPPPAAPAAPPPPPPPAAPAAPPPPPPPPGGITFEQVTQAMSAAVGKKGGAVKCSNIIARYNATAPGTPGPLSVVAPEQWSNIKGEFDAITPDP